MKKIHELSKQKSVRIDHKTIILVDRSIPDNVARDRYLSNTVRSYDMIKKYGIIKAKKKEKEEEVELPDVEKEVDDD